MLQTKLKRRGSQNHQCVDTKNSFSYLLSYSLQSSRVDKIQGRFYNQQLVALDFVSFLSIDPGTKPFVFFSVCVDWISKQVSLDMFGKKPFNLPWMLTIIHIAHRSSGGYFVGSLSEQYGSVFGSAIRRGLKGFVLPMAKNWCTVVQSFFGAAASELLKILQGSSKLEAALRPFAKTNLRVQLGGGRSETFQGLYTIKTPSHRGVSRQQRTIKRTVSSVSRKPVRKVSNR